MEVSIVLSAIAVVISVAAFLSTTLLTLRDQRISREASYIPAFLELMDEFRHPEFHDRYKYVVDDLQREHDPKSGFGLYDLPEPARTAVIDVVYYFQNAAAFVEFGVVDEDKMLAMLHARFVAVWEAVEPYVVTERARDKRADPHLFIRLERYAGRARSMRQDQAISTYLRE